MGLEIFNTLILLLLVAAALVSLRVRDLLTAAVVFGIYSFLMCLLWASCAWVRGVVPLLGGPRRGPRAGAHRIASATGVGCAACLGALAPWRAAQAGPGGRRGGPVC